MRRTATFRDFTRVEIWAGDIGHPPTHSFHLHLNMTCYWVKYDGCWHRAEGRRVGVRLLQDLEACKDIQEAVALNMVLPAWGELPPLAPEAVAARKPPNPIDLLEACTERVHKNIKHYRSVRATKHKR